MFIFILTAVTGAGKTMPSVEEVRRSMGEGGALLQGGAPDVADGLDGDLPLDYTERVQSFFPECKRPFFFG